MLSFNSLKWELYHNDLHRIAPVLLVALTAIPINMRAKRYIHILKDRDTAIPASRCKMLKTTRAVCLPNLSEIDPPAKAPTTKPAVYIGEIMSRYKWLSHTISNCKKVYIIWCSLWKKTSLIPWTRFFEDAMKLLHNFVITYRVAVLPNSESSNV